MHIPEFIKTYGFFLIIAALALWFTYQFVPPPPQKHITIAAGSPSGKYYEYAQIYKKTLEEQGMHVKILETKGSAENIVLLQSEKADIGFVQSGLYTDDYSLESLGSLFYEPLWVFFKQSDTIQLKMLSDLKRLNISIGQDGSGTQALSRMLLEDNDVYDKNLYINVTDNSNLPSLFKNNNVQVAFLVSHINSDLIQTLLNSNDINAFSFTRADAYTKHHPFLSKLSIPKGGINLAKNIPQSDLNLISPVALLLTHEDFHPTLKSLVVQVSKDIHGLEASPFSDKAEFPTLKFSDFPTSAEAERFYKRGKSFFHRYFSFWIADTLDRFVVLLIPLAVLILPFMKIAPLIYKWRVRRKIYRWYKSLKKVEELVRTQGEDIDEAEIDDLLRHIDKEASGTSVPLPYADQLYALRLHVSMIRERLKTIR